MYKYNNCASYLLKKAKYRGNAKVLIEFMQMIPWSVWLGLLNSIKRLRSPKLVPVPLLGWDQKQRGYNQSQLIAQFLGHLFNFSLAPWVMKQKQTRKQSMLKDFQERAENVRGAFIIKPESFVKNQDLIIVDDVITTGATVNSVIKVVKMAGVRKVIAWSIFRSY